MKINITTAFVCDDVRREDNGKLIIIGAYGGNVGIAKIPSRLRLSLVVRALVSEPGETDIEFRALLDGKPQSHQKGHIAIESVSATMFSVPGLSIEIDNPGNLEFQFRLLPSDEWETIFSIPCELIPSPTA